MIIFDYEKVQTNLKTLHQSAHNLDNWAKDLVDQLIYVGEYSLALDEISYAYLNNGMAMPDDLFKIFESLAVAMNMEKDPEFGGVAQLRAETKARLGSGVPNLTHPIVPGGQVIAEQPLTEGNKDAPPAESAKPRGVGLSDERRTYVLDGDGTGGGHGPGRTIPGRSNFPPGWSDDEAIKEILGVANDPVSNRHPGRKGRTIARGTRDGVEIEVVIDQTGTSIITAYPVNIAGS